MVVGVRGEIVQGTCGGERRAGWFPSRSAEPGWPLASGEQVLSGAGLLVGGVPCGFPLPLWSALGGAWGFPFPPSVALPLVVFAGVSAVVTGLAAKCDRRTATGGGDKLQANCYRRKDTG